MPSNQPTFDLEWLQHKIRSKAYRITWSASQTASQIDFDEEDIIDCVLALDTGDFYKSMESEKVKGTKQDVYLPTYLNTRIYLKLRCDETGSTVVISFKRNTSYNPDPIE